MVDRKEERDRERKQEQFIISHHIFDIIIKITRTLLIIIKRYYC